MTGSVTAEAYEELDIEELRSKLQVLGLSTKGSKEVLISRLKKVDLTRKSKDLPMEDNEEEESEYEDNLDTLEVGELKARLRALQLKVTGKKAALVERLRSAESTVKSGEIVDGVNGKNGDNSHKEEVNDFEKLKSKDLKSRLKELGLKTWGTKAVLITRLKAALEGKDDSSSESEESDESSDNDSEDDSQGKRETHVVNNGLNAGENSGMYRLFGYPRSTLTFKDVEDALERFSGDGSQNIRHWFSTFEETAEKCSWSEAQKVIYAKKLLDGSAKLFANYECHAKEWSKLKKRLIKEFSKTVNSKQVHEQLGNVKKKSDESYEAYVYRVLEMASHGDIELEAKLQYIIDGIQDEEVNKSILYGASTVKELRKKLKQYETQKKNSRTKANVKQPQKNDKMKMSNHTRDGGKNKLHCFNCGSKAHFGDNCPDKEKGPRCFNCNEFGHLSTKCTKEKKNTRGEKGKEEKKEKNRCDALKSGDKKTYKQVKILGKEVTAVLDSGSDLHLVRSSCYVRLGAPKLESKTIPFDGVGALNQRTLGRFKADIIIDDLTFKFNFDVVPDEFLGHDLLVGGELSDHAEVRVKHRQAVLKKIESDENFVETGDTGWNEVLVINVCEVTENDYEVSIQHVIDPQIKGELRELVENYTPTKTKDTGVKMRIILQDDVPVSQHPRRLSAEQKKRVNEIIEKWIDEGVVKPSVSDYASPIVLREKENGSLRLCVDYRLLNKKIIKDRNPLPLIEDQLVQ
ncbi:uncharacterized protein LOC107045980 [Diachasma alloeum]|uniref:uncharacterized protein LOC107045980 n=1 Tax=Diachasma alloeum TaxID=454923 RepID=UPI0007381E5F|nr:uncharacterized protein LOC107045980 [Diachasma alloeum]